MFGFSVSIDGDYAIIGAPHDDEIELNAGAAYAFIREGNFWQQMDKLAVIGSQEGEAFGTSVDINGDYVIIGSPTWGFESSSRGKASIISRSGANWILETNGLFGNPGTSLDRFGTSVAINEDGTKAFVGAPGKSSVGAVFVFERTGATWVENTQVQQIDPTLTSLNMAFGTDIEVSGDYLIVGAYNDGVGSAYIYRFNGSEYVEEEKIIPLDGSSSDDFGYEVSIFDGPSSDDEIAIIGTPGDDDNYSNSGSVYIYTRSGGAWSFSQKIYSSDPTNTYRFGVSLDMSDNTIVVGTYHNANYSVNTGAVYVFENNGGWSQTDKLVASDYTSQVFFGLAVATDGNFTVVGAQNDAYYFGAAYVYSNNSFSIDAATGHEQAFIEWSPVTGADEYDVFRSDVGRINATRITATNYNDIGLTNGQQYEYSVVAYNNDSEISRSNNVNLYPINLRSLSGTVDWPGAGNISRIKTTEDISIPSGTIVNIASGSIFEIAPSRDDLDKNGDAGISSINVDGTLNATGVIIRAAGVDAPGDWGGIKFSDQSIGCLLDGCEIHDADAAIYCNGVKESAGLSIINCTISGNNYGVYFINDCEVYLGFLYDDIEEEYVAYKNTIWPNSISDIYTEPEAGEWWGRYTNITFNDYITATPVELSDFSVSFNQDHSAIYWQTQTEENNLGFHVWRSETNEVSEFTKITPSLIQGHGTTSIPQEYYFNDYNIVDGVKYYYQLQQIDYDGTSNWSNVINTTIPYFNTNNTVLIDDFEDVSDWTETWGYNVGTPPSGQILFSIDDNKIEGESSMKISYMFDDDTLRENVRITKELGAVHDLSDMDVLGFWLYGDNSLAGLQIVLGDGDGTYIWRNTSAKGTIIDWSGWKRFDIPLSDFQEGWPYAPNGGWTQIDRIKLILRDDSYGGMGYSNNISSAIYIDDMEFRKDPSYILLENFEDVSDWAEIWGYNVGAPPSGQVEIISVTDQLKIGPKSGKIHYIFDADTLHECVRTKKEFNTELNLSEYNSIGFWLYGDGLDAGFQVELGNSNGAYIWKSTGSKGTLIDFNGWQQIIVSLSDFQEGWPQEPIDGWTNIKYIKIILNDAAYGGCGYYTNINSNIYIDDIVAYDDSYPLSKQVKKDLANNIRNPIVVKAFNRPNPFISKTNIYFNISESDNSYSRVTIGVYDMNGSIISNLFDGTKPQGNYSIEWDRINRYGEIVIPGIYFYKVIINDKEEIGRMMILK